MVKTLPFIGAAFLLTIATVQAQSLTEVLQVAKWPTASTSSSMPTASRLLVSQLQQLLIQNATAGGTGWTDFSRDTYSRYSGTNADLPGTVLNDRWNGSAWVKQVAIRRQFSKTGKLLNDTTISYQISPQGVAYYANVNAYNAADQLVEEKSFSNFVTGTWEELKRNTLTYGSTNLVAEIVEEISLAGAYSPVARRLFTYNAQGQRIEFEAQTSDALGGWKKFQKAFTTYSNNATGNIEQSLAQLVSTDGSTYLNSSRQTTQYDNQSKPILLTTESWENNAWQKSTQVIYTYDALGNPSVATLQTWNGTDYQNTQRVLLTYALVASSHKAQQLNADLTVAPNPVATSATIHYTLPAAGQASVEIVDLMGRRVALVTPKTIQTSGSHTVQLPVSTLSAGLYMVRLQVGNQTQQTKLQVQ